MPNHKVRFNVTRKIALGLALIIAIGMVSTLFIYRGLDEVEGALQRLAAVQAPINAAAYELELNVNGMGLAVLKYLATRRPEYRAWAEKDESDFAHYHTTYLQLVRTERERSLGRRVGELHEEFKGLGHTLMSHADGQEKLYAAITELTEEIDHVIDARLQPGLFSLSTARPDGFGAAVARRAAPILYTIVSCTRNVYIVDPWARLAPTRAELRRELKRRRMSSPSRNVRSILSEIWGSSPTSPIDHRQLATRISP